MPSKSIKENVYAEIVLRSLTGASLITDTPRLTKDNFKMFQGGLERSDELKQKLESAGFKVIAASQFGASILGPLKLYQDFFKTKIVERPIHMFFGGGIQHESNSFFMEETPKIPDKVVNLAENVYIPRKGYFLAGEGAMPTTSYYSLRPPDDIVRLTNADKAHLRGFRGSGIKVAMVDSGFIANHDYYVNRGYNITIHTAVGSANQDEYGHGTGIAANLLAISPECEFHFAKMSDGVQWASLAAFRLAVQAGAKIITNSWGQSRDPVLEAEIVSAVTSGVTVIFACGNGGPIGWPGCMPEVISVGGAFPKQNGTWEASSYASSGVNGLHPERHCPDLSAIVGHAPKGILIIMPTMAGAVFDGSFSGGSFPNGDETGPNDGWLVGSGTSSAAPMVAGAAALLLQAKSSLTPAEVKQALADTCIDVTQGISASGEAAGIGPDSATGAGMINIGEAVDKVSPILPCLRAPYIPCRPAPISCVRAPICRVAPVVCTRAPTVCTRLPISCLRAPTTCTRAPFICRTAPIIECLRAPTIPNCSRGPSNGCLAGPWKKPIDPNERVINPENIREPIHNRLVPVVVLVDESELQYLMAEEEAYALDQELGMMNEYANFPNLEGCNRGPFNPNCDE